MTWKMEDNLLEDDGRCPAVMGQSVNELRPVRTGCYSRCVPAVLPVCTGRLPMRVGHHGQYALAVQPVRTDCHSQYTPTVTVGKYWPSQRVRTGRGWFTDCPMTA